jgi:hypothetical protein
MSQDNDEIEQEPVNSFEETDDREEYQVGYKKPPKHSQFKKGEPSPRKGKKRKAYYYDEIFWEVARETIEVNIAGKVKKMSRIEACIRKMAQLALSGDRATLLHYTGAFAGDVAMKNRDASEIARRIKEGSLKIDPKTFEMYET